MMGVRTPAIWRSAVALCAIKALTLVILTDAASQTGDNTILPGVGLADVGIGDTQQEVNNRWGPADDTRYNFVNYYYSRSVSLIFEDDRVGQMRFFPGFSGKTADGVGPGDSLFEMLESTGAERFLRVDIDSVSMAPNAEWGLSFGAFGFSVSQPYKGISYWISPDHAVGQIAVFAPADREPAHPAVLPTMITTNEKVALAKILSRVGRYLLASAEANPGQYYPDLSSTPGELTMALGLGEGHRLVQPHLPAEDQEAWQLLESDDEVFYLGYAVTGDEDIESFAEAYRQMIGIGGDFSNDLETLSSRPEGMNKFYHLRVGVEHLYFTEIEYPRTSLSARMDIPVLIQWPREGEDAGGNVLFLSGHVEFIKYPGRWPMTEKTIGILKDLAGRQ